MSARRTLLPHTGIATFAKAPYVGDLTSLDADVGILGVPTDAAAGIRPGCRQAPRAIRDASTCFGFVGQRGTTRYFDINQERRLLDGVRKQEAATITRVTREVKAIPQVVSPRCGRASRCRP